MSDEDEIYIDEFLDQVENGDSTALGSTLDQEDQELLEQDSENIEDNFEQESEEGEIYESISREDIYEAVLQAIQESNEIELNENKEALQEDQNDIESNEVIVKNLPDSYSDNSVQFATGTDATFMTVQPSGAIGSADAQMVAYMVDTRNIVVLGFSILIILQFYKLIKGTFIKFVKGRKDSI